MASLKELNYNIRNLIRGGILSDDERIAEKQMNFIINYVRALFVKQMLDKNQALHYSLLQTVCIDLELVDKSCDPDTPTDCIVLRSVEEIPQILRTNHSLGGLEVKSLDGELSFPVISQSRAKWSSFNRYTSMNKRSYLRGNHLYLINDVFQEKACMTAIFADPEAANEASCTPLLDEYPLPTDMIDGLTNHIIRNIVMLTLMTNTDEYNDSNGRIINSFRSSRNDYKENPQDS